MGIKNSHSGRELYFMGLRSYNGNYEGIYDVNLLYRFRTVHSLMKSYKVWMEFVSMLQMESELIVLKSVGKDEFKDVTTDISKFVVLDNIGVLEKKYLD